MIVHCLIDIVQVLLKVDSHRLNHLFVLVHNVKADFSCSPCVPMLVDAVVLKDDTYRLTPAIAMAIVDL